jgi:hypothetical protein
MVEAKTTEIPNVQITYKKDRILLAPSTTSEEELTTLKHLVETIVTDNPGTLRNIKVEAVKTYNRMMLKVTSESVSEEPNELDATLKALIYYEPIMAIRELTQNISNGLFERGYSVKFAEPPKESTPATRAKAGKPVKVKFLIEQDCITLGVDDIFDCNVEFTVDPDIILEDLKAASDKIQTLLDLLMPEDDLEIALGTKHYPKIKRNTSTFLDATKAYSVYEIKDPRVKMEEMIVIARQLKKFFKSKYYEVEAEVSQRVTTPINL